MSNARLGTMYAVTRLRAGRVFVWEVEVIDDDDSFRSLIFANEQDANAYVAALRAVAVTQRAAITLPPDVELVDPEWFDD